MKYSSKYSLSKSLYIFTQRQFVQCKLIQDRDNQQKHDPPSDFQGHPFG